MNLYLLELVSKLFGIIAFIFISLFNFSSSNEEIVINNDVDNKNSYIKTEVINYETEYIYDASLPSTHEKVITEGKDGILSLTDGKIIEEAVSKVIEIGTGKKGIYEGMLTGYGPDCKGCSELGYVYCATKEKTYHSLVNDGIYYNDHEYGEVRILAADHREFPCGTIIEITNSDREKEIGVVLDTGSGMRNAYSQGWILIDLAFEKEALALSTTNKNTHFEVKRWGW